jgi:S-adenosyl-L-methionine hydrolase (adenosine-forming)
MPRQMVATLLTDFGLRDPYAATMKGVMISLCPDIHIVDISHAVDPHDILGAGFILAQAVTSFPPETVHVIVVDPEVGTQREILAARFGGQHFVFPDNGLISFIAASLPMEQIVAVRDKRYFRTPAPSNTFHGRDIMAPVAARILMGLDLRRLGPKPDRYKILDLPRVAEKPSELVGQVLYVDRFGNLITNITDTLIRHHWDTQDRIRIVCNGHEIGPLRGTYSGGPEGQPLAIINSMGLLEIALNRGRAAHHLEAHVGTEVRLTSGTGDGSTGPALERE